MGLISGVEKYDVVIILKNNSSMTRNCETVRKMKAVITNQTRFFTEGSVEDGMLESHKSSPKRDT